MDIEILKELSEEYGIPVERIKSYYNKLQEYPFVENSDEDLVKECLERIVQDVSTNEFLKENNQNQRQKQLKYSISDALYNVYGDEAINYLDEDYIEKNQKRHNL